MKRLSYVAGLLGVLLVIGLLLHFNSHDLWQLRAQAGWQVLWLVPYRGTYFLLYALGWHLLLRPVDPQGRAPFPCLFWLTGLREAIDRLLPVASVGGAFIGMRMLHARAIARVQAAASIITEILLTVCASYLFALIGFFLALNIDGLQWSNQRGWLILLCTLPVPIGFFVVLRQGALFDRAQRFLAPIAGLQQLSENARTLDQALRAFLSRTSTLWQAGALQLAALASASLEIWLALRWFGHPIGLTGALILESATQAVRHIAFFIPAGLGAQELGLVAFGHVVGITPELALAVSMAKRLREILCGAPYLLVWQWQEGFNLRQATARGPQS